MPSQRVITIGRLSVGNELPITLIAGPCAIESRAHALEMSHALVEIAARLRLNLIYKSSFDKANRTSLGAERGLGLDRALAIFADILHRKPGRHVEVELNGR